MISIVVCSVNPTLSEALLENISDTAGVPYEVICVDNSTGRYTIFEAYNYGASVAKYDLLCFMHEDILFHTRGWGEIVAGKLRDNEVGVIGVAGAVYKPASPSPWWISDTEDRTAYHRLNILQHFSTGVKRQRATAGSGPWDEVVVLDGVWLCCRRDVWLRTPFDGQRYKGFHFYDLDFSFSVHAGGFRNFVSQEILIEHFSAGNMDTNWIRGAAVFHKKWRKVLPGRVGDIPAREMEGLELSAARNFLRIMTYNRYHDLRLWLKYWLKTASHDPLKRETVRSLMQYGRTYFK
ncbi:MAG TPA: glycosyltransferase [Puia sp.]|nr:glycosyltransferase [Puia sp.]